MNDSVPTTPDGTLVLDDPVTLPDVLDVLVVGAGPAGTAAAFRAKELGLSALVIEHDDILKRIRDYDRTKSIKPDFGAGRQMRFPIGGDLVAKLHFSEMPGSEMCRQWRALYARHSVPVQIGVELVGLDPAEPGVWKARARNRLTTSDQAYRARHVVLALGGGMPRRLDIPGNVRAIRDRLDDASRFVGQPACVLGGGTSAAEAVIAISHAKVAAGDRSAVFWSHRGNRMPTVSEALASELFRATKVAGNVRYLPSSEARAVVESSDRVEILQIETDRRVMPDRPTETTELEFAAGSCIACIGQEIDWALLHAMGILPVTAGARNRRGLPLNRVLESRRTNVYVVGDTLNAAYFECDDFDGDTSTFREVKHRGNIKASLIDGVTVIEAIAQKLAGRTEIDVELTFAEPDAPTTARPAAGTPAPRAAASPVDAATTEATSPAPSPAAGQGASQEADVVLVRLLGARLEAEQFTVAPDGVTTIGRHGCDISFEDDSLLADRHASIMRAADGYFLKDERSATGVYLRVDEGRTRTLPEGSLVRLGRQWLAFGDASDPSLIVHYDPDGREVGRYRLDGAIAILGRDPESAFRSTEPTKVQYIALDPTDMTLSRRHAAITREAGHLRLRDLQSTNGADIRIEGTVQLEPGDVLRLGNQTLRFGTESAMQSAEHIVTSVASPPEATGGTAVELDPETRLVVTFRESGQTCPFTRGQSICEIAEAHGVKIAADCHAGICGSDPIRVVEGQDLLNPMSDAERATIEDICCIDPDGHRLACVSRPTGPVVVEFVHS